MSKKNTKVKKENKKPKSKEKDLEVDVVTNDVDDVQKEKEKFLRLFAEFENYKKRTTKERIELFSTASQELMTSLLPVLDDFDRANQEIIKNSDDEIYKGVSLIQNKLFDTLKSKGLKIVEVNKGDGEKVRFTLQGHDNTKATILMGDEFIQRGDVSIQIYRLDPSLKMESTGLPQP